MDKILRNLSSSSEFLSFKNGGFRDKNGEVLFLLKDLALIGNFRGLKMSNSRQ